MPRSKEIKLDRLLDTVFSAVEEPSTDLHPGDKAFLRQEYRNAEAAYAIIKRQTNNTRAKRGFCLALSGRDSEAEALLTPDNVGRHPVARAVLARVLAGRHGSRLISGFGSKEDQEKRQWRERQVMHLLGSALEEIAPPRVAFAAAFEIGYRAEFDTLSLAERACELYPDWDTPHGIRAQKRRLAGRADHTELESLLRFVPRSNCEKIFNEAYVLAMSLARFDDADSVVDRVETIVIADEQKGDGNRAGIDEMRAMVDLHRAREGEPSCYRRVKNRIAPWAADKSPRQADGREPAAAPAFLLQVALETNDIDSVVANAEQIIDQLWPTGFSGPQGIDGWGPLISSSSLFGVLQIDQIGFNFSSRWREILTHLSAATAGKWRLLLSANAIANGEPDNEQLQIMRSAGHENSPWWIALLAYSAFTEFEPYDFKEAGALLALLAHRISSLPDEEAAYCQADIEMLPVDDQSSEDVVLMFEGALTWLGNHPESSAQELLNAWGQIIGDNGGHDVLARISTLSLKRSNSALAREYLELANELADDSPAAAVRRILSNLPDPKLTRTKPEELSLLEAAALVALMRAAQIDHIEWTLTPIAASGRSFEPTNKFRKVLWQLMHKGVITPDISTPAHYIEAKDGQLWATLNQVVWRISTHTLELHRTIRELPHSMWPQEWKNHAPILSRDLGVEEMIVYITYQLESRDIPVPEQDELRAVFSNQLEKLAISQCYYLAYKTALSALDYKTKYRNSGIQQIKTRILNLLRENGERAVEKGWDTRYRRIKEVPMSLLFEAVHDVLTGWGERAFDEPVMTLSLDES
ncbi:hypothetical protein [Lysobacter sp. 1R34A]|uniref:hypothetical protein n=1 Tax=Lysobacter sp. 1R34A TaxID=3445786 RepID=UPI003EE94F3F